MILRSLKYVWALPNTLLGLILLALVAPFGARIRPVGGVLEVHGRAVDWLLRHAVPLRGGAAAVTLGHMVYGRDAEALEVCRLHERVHVQQCERWGPFFIPAYLAAGLIALLLGKRPYADNYFEVRARQGDQLS